MIYNNNYIGFTLTFLNFTIILLVLINTFVIKPMNSFEDKNVIKIIILIKTFEISIVISFLDDFVLKYQCSSVFIKARYFRSTIFNIYIHI